VNESELDPEILQLAREEAEERLENIEKNLLALEGGSIGPEAVDELFRDAHSIKSAAAMLDWKDVAAIAHVMEDRFDECREGEASLADLTDPMLRGLDGLKRAIGDDGFDVAPLIAELEAAGPASGAQSTGGGRERVEGPPVPSPSAATNGTPKQAADGGAPIAEQSIRVPAGKIDRMLDAVGETVLHHRRLEHVLSDGIATAGEEESEQELDLGSRLLDELHDSAIGMRTLPLSSITAPFPRAVRDTAAAEGKEVELSMTGTETQLDRSILEGLGELINHLLRNAVAHGIGSPDEREAAGKPRRGTVELRAERRGGMASIEISDDGVGVSAELLAKAEENGSLTELLAAPGFSTADSVSGIAGRGVGLDAVKEHVEGLGGNLEVQSRPGEGTRVTMLLPLTLSVMKLLMCERAGQPFGLPLTSVREVVTASRTVTLGGRRALDLNDEAVDLEDLAVALGASAPELPEDAPAMVVGAAGRWRAISCDTVLGDHEVVVKGLGPLLAGVRGYLGAAILGDGRVALILDPNHLVRGSQQPATPGSKLAVPTEGVEAPRILVVDDQIAMRELQRSILETAGYRVQTACDGRDALERMAKAEMDMVLTDVEMPEMDGFELLRVIRDDSERASLPVVMVSSLGSAEQRQRGADEGADAYIVKEEYDQQALLEMVSRLVGT
jgi:two-component system, chemotaxis family, sensor kinase CheA